MGESEPDLNPRTHEEKKVTRMHEGGVNRTPPSIFKSIQPIDVKLGMINKHLIYFQLNIVTWHLIGFHGNRSLEMTFPRVKIVFFNDIHAMI